MYLPNVNLRKRDDYYVFQKDYYVLKKLSEMFHIPDLDYKIIIKYIISNNIDVNSYIYYKKDVYVPIIYKCSLTPSINHQKCFKWLLDHGANPYLIPDAEKENRVNILFVCNEIYIPSLNRKNDIKNDIISKIDIDIDNVLNKLRYGNLRRLIILNKYGYIDTIISYKKYIDDKFYFEMIDIMITRINLICKTSNDGDMITKVIDKYVEIYRLLDPDPNIKYNNTSLLQYIINFYLVKLAKLLITRYSTKEDIILKYHTEFDPLVVAVLRHLYNDRNFYELSNLI